MEIRSNAFEPARPSLPSADITRPNRETIERRTPEPSNPEDVRARLAQQKQVLAERAAAARQAQLAERAQNARETLKAQRVANARAQLAGEDAAVRPAAADSGEAAPGASQAERAASVREALLAERAQNARAKKLSERAQGARESLLQQRIEGARDKVSLSETSLRLRAQAAREPDGAERAERVSELRALHQQGALNTDELIARAAYKMLSGE